MSWQMVGVLALVVASANLLMSFARTGPEEAVKNIARWFQWLREKRVFRFLSAFIHSPIWRIANTIIFILGAVGFLYPTSFWRVAQPPTNIQSMPSALPRSPDVSARNAPPVVQPADSSENLTTEDIATKTSIWESVLHHNLNTLVGAYNAIDVAQSRWVEDVETEAGRLKLMDALDKSNRLFINASAALETLRAEYPNYRDVSEGLVQPGKVALSKAIVDVFEVVANNQRGAPNLDIQLRPFIGALRREMNSTSMWLQRIRDTADKHLTALSKLK